MAINPITGPIVGGLLLGFAIVFGLYMLVRFYLRRRASRARQEDLEKQASDEKQPDEKKGTNSALGTLSSAKQEVVDKTSGKAPSSQTRGKKIRKASTTITKPSTVNTGDLDTIRE